MARGGRANGQTGEAGYARRKVTLNEPAMTRTQEIQREPAKVNPSGVLKLEFAKDTAFQMELRRRVDELFRSTGRRKRDCWQMYLKTAIIFACFAASYALLVFEAHTLWQGLPLAVVLGLSTALIGFNVQHDAGHQAYSERRRVNQLMAMTMDVIGGSSYVWRWKHTVIHHMYVNITGYDNDIDLGILGRLSPHHQWRWYYRWQRFYLWPLYGLEAMKMQLVDSFRYVITGRLGLHRIPRPQRWELVIFIAGRVIFFSWAFAIPMLFHPVMVVLFYYVVASMVLGLVLSLVFVMPHCAGGVDFPLPTDGNGSLKTPWAVHQAQSTLNFARHNRVLTWLLGGLNYHKEHHLFPLICHIHYPAMSRVVEETCRDFGLRYKEHESFLTGIASHYRWLRRMGLPPAK
jgi:linoleoyl-CoA desaturase